jgi:molybdenum cofactor synthesis domain-containing protein
VSDTKTVTAAVLVIGDEILSGRTQDKNTNAIAAHLTSIGVRLREARVVGDVEDEIVAALNDLRAKYDYVFTTGGIGPTHDDITADSVAKAFGVPIAVDPRAQALLQAYYDRRRLELTPSRLRMARVPDGAELLDNPVSGAPGFRIGNVIVMAGVPDIMRAMLQAATPGLETGAKLISETISVDRPESEIADVFAAHQRLFPDVAMGSYPLLRNGGPAADLVLRAADAERLRDAANAIREALGLPH